MANQKMDKELKKQILDQLKKKGIEIICPHCNKKITVKQNTKKCPKCKKEIKVNFEI